MLARPVDWLEGGGWRVEGGGWRVEGGGWKVAMIGGVVLYMMSSSVEIMHDELIR